MGGKTKAQRIYKRKRRAQLMKFNWWIAPILAWWEAEMALMVEDPIERAMHRLRAEDWKRRWAKRARFQYGRTAA